MSENKKSKSGVWALLAKLGPKLLGLLGKLAKLIKFTKVGLAALTFAGYATIYNWKFAVLIMVAVGWHESGHVWAMKKKGLKTKGFYFLPFIGGAAIQEENYKTYQDNFYVSIMGPVWGAILAFICAGAYLITNISMLAAATGFMCMINLFNLLPINPLDGGQIVRSISFSLSSKKGINFLIISFILSIIAFILIQSGLFILITIVGGMELFFEYKKYKLAKAKEQYGLIFSNTDLENYFPSSKIKYHYPDRMNSSQIKTNSLLYVGLIVILFTLLKTVEHLPGADLAASFLR